jgi:hypothetical protein
VVNLWEKKFKELVEEEGEVCTMDGRRRSKSFDPNLKP